MYPPSSLLLWHQECRRQPDSMSRRAFATSTQRCQPLSADSWVSDAVIGVRDVSSTVSPKASSARSQRSVCSLGGRPTAAGRPREPIRRAGAGSPVALPSVYSARGVVWSPLVRTHWLECSLRSE